MKTLFVIVTASKFRDTRQKALRETWLKGQNHIFASDELGYNTLNLSSKKGHASAEEKQINAIRYVARYSIQGGIDKVFFCDDDTFVNVRNLSDNVVNCGHVLSEESDPRNPLWKQRPNFRYYSGGAGFVLDIESVKKIAALEIGPWTGFGDIKVGEMMARAGLQLNNHPSFFKDSPEHFGHSAQVVRSALTYHYIKPDRMRTLWEETA